MAKFPVLVYAGYLLTIDQLNWLGAKRGLNTEGHVSILNGYLRSHGIDATKAVPVHYPKGREDDARILMATQKTVDDLSSLGECVPFEETEIEKEVKGWLEKSEIFHAPFVAPGCSGSPSQYQCL